MPNTKKSLLIFFLKKTKISPLTACTKVWNLSFAKTADNNYKVTTKTAKVRGFLTNEIVFYDFSLFCSDCGLIFCFFNIVKWISNPKQQWLPEGYQEMEHLTHCGSY